MGCADTQEDYLETLRRIVAELGPQRSFQASLRFVLHILAERHAFLRPHMVMFEPHSRTLRLWMADTSPMAADVVYEPGVGITGQVFTLGRPVIVERLCENNIFQNKFFSRTEQEMRELAFLSVPVVGRMQLENEDPEVLGVLSLDTPVAPREELEAHCRFLTVVAGLVGMQASQQQLFAKQWRHGMLPPEADSHGVCEDRVVIAVSRAMRQVLAQVEQAGSSSEPVLLCGEAGTGKELLAEVLHRASLRSHMPLLRINCAAMNPDALEEELFGVQKGASPQVMQTRKGVIEQAHMGSLYLAGAEVLPEALQKRLLQVMQTQELYRIGGTHGVQADVRFICGWQRGEGANVQAGAQAGVQPDMQPDMQTGMPAGGRADIQPDAQPLRKVLWNIDVPPLRERAEDILPLAEEFLRRGNKGKATPVRRISMAAVELLTQHAWQGNVLELKCCMERAVQHCEDDRLLACHLPPSLQRGEAGGTLNFSEAVAHYEQEILEEALQKAQGNILEASRQLQTSYRIIHYKVKKYGLDPRKFGSRQSISKVVS